MSLTRLYPPLLPTALTTNDLRRKRPRPMRVMGGSLPPKLLSGYFSRFIVVSLIVLILMCTWLGWAMPIPASPRRGSCRCRPRPVAFEGLGAPLVQKSFFPLQPGNALNDADKHKKLSPPLGVRDPEASSLPGRGSFRAGVQARLSPI